MPYLTKFSKGAQRDKALKVGDATIGVVWHPQGAITVLVDAPNEVAIDWVGLPETMQKADKEVRSSDATA